MGKTKQLPADHKERNQLLSQKLSSGDIMQIAAVVRDLTTRERDRGELTTVTKRNLKKSFTMLAGEIAAAQGIELDAAEAQIRAQLTPASSPAAY